MRTIQIEITGEAGQYEATINRITERNRQMNRHAIEGAQQTQRALESVTSALGLFLKGFVAFQAVNFIGKFSAFAEQLNLVSKRTKIAVEDLDALQRVATLSGSNFQEVGDSMRFLNKAIAESSDTGSEASKIFKALGIDVQGIIKRGGNAKDVMLSLADSFKNNLDVAGRYLAAQKLLGRSSEGLINVMILGRDEIEKQIEEQKKLGVITTATAQAANDARDKWEQFKIIAQAKVGGPLIDFLSDVLNMLEKTKGLIVDNIRLWGLFRAQGSAGALLGGVVEQPGAPGLKDVIAQSLKATPATGDNRQIDLARAIKDDEQAKKAITERAKALEDLQKRVQAVRNEIANPAGDAGIKALQEIEELEKTVAKFNDPTMRGLVAIVRQHTEAKIEETKALEANKAVIEQVTALNTFLAESEAAEITRKEERRAEIEAELALKADLLALDTERLRAMGFESAARQKELQDLINLNEERKRILDDAANRGDIFRQAGEAARITKQTDIAQAKLEQLGKVTINVGQTIANSVGDAFEGVILGTRKLGDVGKGLMSALLRDVGQFFTQALLKKAGFENLLLSNVNSFVPQLSGTVGAAGGVLPGSQGGGGGGGIGGLLNNGLGLLSNLFGGGGGTGGGAPNGGGIFAFAQGLAGGGSGGGSAGGALGGFGGLANAGLTGLGFLGGMGNAGNLGIGGQIAGTLGSTLLTSSLSAMLGWGGGLLGTLFPALMPLLANPITAIIGAIIVAITQIFGAQVPNPSAWVDTIIKFYYDAATERFNAVVQSTLVRFKDIKGSTAQAVLKEHQIILDSVAQRYVEILNTFPVAVHDSIVPFLDEANRVLDQLLGGKKYSEGGSRSIQDELRDLREREAPAAFFLALRRAIGVGIDQTLQTAGIDLSQLINQQFPSAANPARWVGSSVNFGSGLRLPTRPDDIEPFLDALTQFIQFTGQLSTISPRGIQPFITGVDQTRLQAELATVLGSDTAGFADAVEEMLERVKPLTDFLQKSVTEASQLFGRGMIAALEATTASQANRAFMQSLGQGTKDIIFQGITEAFIASAQFTDLLAPIQKTIREFTQEAIATGQTPDIEAFRRAIFPAIEEINTRADLIAQLVPIFQELGLDIKKLLGLTGEGVGGSGTINITINGDIQNEKDAADFARRVEAILRPQLPPPS